jgi:hypothetical protein
MAKTVTDACLERQAWQLAYIEEAGRRLSTSLIVC